MVKSVLIGTFSVWKNRKRTAINGMIEPLLSFFSLQTVDLIDGPHPGSEKIVTTFEHYQNEKLEKKRISIISLLMYPFLKNIRNNSTQLSFKLRDFLSAFEFVLRSPKKYDLFIGLESIFTLSGIFLKQLGFIKIVVYYVSDYSPQRYSNLLLNNIYLALDRFCCYHADYIWDVSPAMHPARIKAGLDPKKSVPVILVPNALFPSQISIIPKNKLLPDSLVYAGTLGSENGIEVAIEALPIILQKFPKASLHIIGGDAELEPDLKQLVKENNIEKNVVFHGFVPAAQGVTKAIQKYMVGLAPYRAFPGSARWYADATKIRLYMGAGIPVISSQVPPLGKVVQEKGAAIIALDNKEDLASAVIKILSDKKLYEKMRDRAIAFAKDNTWNNVYRGALKQMQLKTG